MAEFARQVGDRDAFDGLFVAAPIADQVGDGDGFHTVLRGEFEQLRRAHHRAVFPHDFAAEAAFFHAREVHQVHRCLRMAGADQDAALARLQREHVPRTAEIGGGGVRRDALDRRDGALDSGNAGGGGDMVDGDGKSRMVVVRVAVDHLVEAQFFGEGLIHRHADQAFAVGGHEIDVLRRRVAGGAHQVAFVFPFGVVDDDDDASQLQLFQSFFNGG